MGSDVTSLGARDTFIGWTKDNKFKDGKLKHTSIGTTIYVAQPLGFNFLGGKLVAALVTSSVVRECLERVVWTNLSWFIYYIFVWYSLYVQFYTTLENIRFIIR